MAASLLKAIAAAEAGGGGGGGGGAPGSWSWDLQSRLLMWDTRAGRVGFRMWVERLNEPGAEMLMSTGNVVEFVKRLAAAGFQNDSKAAWSPGLAEVRAAVERGELPLKGPAAALVLTALATHEAVTLVGWYRLFEALQPYVEAEARHRRAAMNVLLHACAAHGQLAPAVNTLRVMASDGVSPDVESYCLVTQAALRAKEATPAKAHFARAQQLVADQAPGYASSLLVPTERMLHRFLSLSKSTGQPPVGP